MPPSLYRKAADSPVLLLLTVSLVSPTVLRHRPTPSLVRNSPKYGIFGTVKKYDFNMFFLSLLCFQFDNNYVGPTGYAKNNIYGGIFLGNSIIFLIFLYVGLY